MNTSTRVLVLALLSGTFTRAGEVEKDKAKTVFRTVAVKRGDVVEKVRATGTLQPEDVVEVGAQVAGRIERFGTDAEKKAIDFGSRVEHGTILAQVDPAL